MHTPQIRSIYVINSMVLTFNDRAQQMSEYQGTREEVLEKALRDAPDEARFYGPEGEMAVAEWRAAHPDRLPEEE